MSVARVAILQFPGVNCEAESARALRRVSLEAEVFRWTRPAAELTAFDAFVLPGGFSYQDRVRAGALAAKSELVDVLADEAERGKPVLGICNGAQVLIESGMVPRGQHVDLALARNRMTARSGYYTRWIYVRVEPSACVFTRHLRDGTLLPLPVAHGEGRFTSRSTAALTALSKSGQTPLRYATPDGDLARSFPHNPNGSHGAIAAVCNARGNVLAMMPHPERALEIGAIARSVAGEWGAKREAGARSGPAVSESAGPGTLLFEGLARHLAGAR
jgi:phosphoribosylformylglycinamidine synthase subunit PurQ / glutaminase